MVLFHKQTQGDYFFHIWYTSFPMQDSDAGFSDYAFPHRNSRTSFFVSWVAFLYLCCVLPLLFSTIHFIACAEASYDLQWSIASPRDRFRFWSNSFLSWSSPSAILSLRKLSLRPLQAQNAWFCQIFLGNNIFINVFPFSLVPSVEFISFVCLIGVPNDVIIHFFIIVLMSSLSSLSVNSWLL